MIVDVKNASFGAFHSRSPACKLSDANRLCTVSLSFLERSVFRGNLNENALDYFIDTSPPFTAFIIGQSADVTPRSDMRFRTHTNRFVTA